jgi:DNA helicase MCM8
MSSTQPLNAPDFVAQQQEDCRRLWEAQHREDPDAVRPHDDSSSSSVASSGGGKAAKAPWQDPLTLQHMARLHQFFLAFLNHASGNPTFAYLRSVRESCLGSYAKIFLATDEGDTNHHHQQHHLQNSTSATNTSTTKTRLRLRTGRHVLTLHYEEFISELNRFECQGDPNPEYVRGRSYGAWLHHFPLQALPALNVSMALAVATLWRAQPNIPMNQQSKLYRFLDSCQCTVRLIHVLPRVPMADIKTGLVKKFLSVKGNVIKARPKRLRVATADFSCPKCAAVVAHSFEQGRFSLPTKCSNDSCKARTFTLIRPTARYTNVQELRLQESQEESTSHAGRTPRQLEVLLTQPDLIDSCRPGDIVLLACHVDAINTAVAAGRAGKRALQETSTYKLFLQGHSITTLSEKGGGRSSEQQKKQGGASQQNVYSQQQIQNITQLCHADHRCLSLMERRAFPFDLLVRSVCPSIIGHHSVKAGILLCLLGGTPTSLQQQQQDKGNSIRSNSHILIVGDPGMGKSQMLNAATQLAARSVYVGGNTSSTTGLTVTLTKEEGGETGIEAGALVLADQGVACIDELDKCKHLDGLLEAMEQQQVSIAKAGVVACLPARCSVIAAANPKHGSYNMSKTVAENLNMARPILSRFDLVFILRDRADKDQDRLVSSNIMNLYRRQGNGAGGDSTTGGGGAQDTTAQLAEQYLTIDKENSQLSQGQQGQERKEKKRVPLEKRLAWVSGFNEPLPAGLVRDYIAYAREFCKPKLTVEAAEILKEYYMNLRYPTDGRSRRDTVPITTRQLEALIRLSQARAKACLREFVLREDALDVVDLLRRSVEQVHTDEYGIVDRTRAGAAGLSNRKMRKLFTQEVYNMIGTGAECSLDDLRRVADRAQCSISEFSTIIEDMRSNGILMKKPDGRYQVLS